MKSSPQPICRKTSMSILQQRPFFSYMGLEILCVLYLGIWNAIIPILILRHGDANDLIHYEATLAIVAALAIPLLSHFTENKARHIVLRWTCLFLFFVSVARYFLLHAHYNILGLIALDLLAVFAFAIMQPLFGVYPAETVAAAKVSKAFRLQKSIKSFGRIAAPACTAFALMLVQAIDTLIIASVVSLLALALALSLPAGFASNKSTHQRQFLDNITLGLRACMQLPPERFFTMMNIGTMILISSTLPIIVPMLAEKNHLPTDTLARCSSAYAAGLFLGALIWSSIAEHYFKAKTQYLITLFGLLLCLVLLASAHSANQMMLCVFPLGMVSSSIALLGFSRRALAIPQHIRIRFMAMNILFSQLASAIGFIGAGLMLKHFHEVGLIVWFFMITIPMFFYILFAESPWEMLAQPCTEVGNYYIEKFPVASKLFA